MDDKNNLDKDEQDGKRTPVDTASLTGGNMEGKGNDLVAFVKGKACFVATLGSFSFDILVSIHLILMLALHEFPSVIQHHQQQSLYPKFSGRLR